MPRLNLPSPRRIVRRSVGVGRRLGYTQEQGLLLVMSCCAYAKVTAAQLGEHDLAWLAEVYEEAWCRLYDLRYPNG